MNTLEEETPTAGHFPDKEYYARLHHESSSGSDGLGRGEEGDNEMRRRGSVDDRTMTMSGVRLFVANPDID